MFCKKCGATIQDDAVFCIKCGAKVDSQEATSKVPIPQEKKIVYCRKCGNAFLEGYRYCPACGDNQKKPSAIIIITAIAAVMIVVLLIITVKPKKIVKQKNGSDSPSTNESLIADLAEAIDLTIPDEGDTPDYMEPIIEDLKMVTGDSFGKEHCSIVCNGNTITMSVWNDGVSSGAVSATTNPEVKVAWDLMATNIQAMNQQAYSLASASGHPEVVIITNVVSETDKESILLSYKNGENVFDVVNDYLK